MFIVFEGSDGVGKSTQIALLADYFKQKGIAYILTREPGGTPVGEKTRQLLLDPQNPMHALTEAYLYAASRAEHVQKVIAPALKQGISVIGDRFVHSSMAYQGFGRGLGVETVREINQRALGGVMPDRVYLLMHPSLIGIARKHAQKHGDLDRLEREGKDFFARVEQGFAHLAASDASILPLDASLSVEDIASLIREDVDRVLKA